MPLLPKVLFLTKYEVLINQPERIGDVWVFRYALKDDTYRDVEIRYEYAPWWFLSTDVLVGGAILGLIGLNVFFRSAVWV